MIAGRHLFEATIQHNIILATAMADGLSISKIATLMGLSAPTVRKHFKESLDGYTFKRKSKNPRDLFYIGKNTNTERDLDMVIRFKNGETLREIGEKYGVCRERVRQILYRYGMNRESGGMKLKALKEHVEKNRLKLERRKERLMNHFGCTIEQYDYLRGLYKERKNTPILKWTNQRRNAISRGIEWGLTLWEWWEIWLDSGRYESRGIGKGKYVMGRIADTGSYLKGNVEILLCEDNSKDYYDVHYDEWIEIMLKRNPKLKMRAK